MLGRENPDLAQQVATRNHTKPDDNAELIAAVSRGWAARDPAAALEWLTSLELSERHRTKALNELFAEWARSDLAAAREALKAVRPETSAGSQYSLGFVGNPESAASGIFLGLHLDPMLEVSGLYQQLSNSPIDWEKFQSMIPPIDRDGWFLTDPAKAAEEATRLPPGKARDFLMSYICGQWADRNPEEATAYARSHGLRDPFVRDEPSAESVRAALSSPDETFANLFTPQAAGSPERLKNLAEKWAAIEPQAAAEWLISQPDSVSYNYLSNVQAKSLLDNAIGYYWARVDAIGASNWVEDLPEGPRKTEAWQAANHYVGEYCPDLAFAISAGILHDETRLGALKSDLRKVAEKVGQPAARELVRTTELAPQERTALLQVLDTLPPKP